jgi:hypothetical protein
VADAVSRRRTSGYRARFALAYALVAAVFVGVIVLFAFLVSQNEAPRWSAYQPKGNGIERAQDIANHIAPSYREGGTTLAAVNAQRPVINSANVDAFAIARAPTARVGGGIEKLEPADKSMFYVFCGSGQRCAVPGEPTPGRALLLRREALELALYTFKYMQDVESVVALLPPVGNVNTAAYFKRSAMGEHLDKPLFETLPTQGPFEADGAAVDDGEQAEQLAANSFFQSGVQQLPTGGALLVLTPPPGR